MLKVTPDQAADRARELFLDDSNGLGCAETAFVVLKDAYGLPQASVPSAALTLQSSAPRCLTVISRTALRIVAFISVLHFERQHSGILLAVQTEGAGPARPFRRFSCLQFRKVGLAGEFTCAQQQDHRMPPQPSQIRRENKMRS